MSQTLLRAGMTKYGESKSKVQLQAGYFKIKGS